MSGKHERCYIEMVRLLLTHPYEDVEKLRNAVLTDAKMSAESKETLSGFIDMVMDYRKSPEKDLASIGGNNRYGSNGGGVIGWQTEECSV